MTPRKALAAVILAAGMFASFAAMGPAHAAVIGDACAVEGRTVMSSVAGQGVIACRSGSYTATAGTGSDTLATITARGATTTATITAGGVTSTSSIKLGNDTGSCTSAKAGTIRWSGTAFEGCNGTAWAALTGTGSSTTRIKAKYWRLRGTEQMAGSNYWWRVAELEMFADGDTTTDVTSTAKAVASSNRPNEEAWRAFDNNLEPQSTESMWGELGTGDPGNWSYVNNQWVGQAFEVPMAITKMRFWPRYTGSGNYPHAAQKVTIDYSNDGGVWVPLKEFPVGTRSTAGQYYDLTGFND